MKRRNFLRFLAASVLAVPLLKVIAEPKPVSIAATPLRLPVNDQPRFPLIGSTIKIERQPTITLYDPITNDYTVYSLGTTPPSVVYDTRAFKYPTREP